MTISGRLAAILLAGAAMIALSAPAHAATDAATQARIEHLEAEIRALAGEVQELKQQAAGQDAAAPATAAAGTHVTIDNARPTITSGDGKFSASIRALGQLDAAYYSQGHRARHLPAANGPDLSSGSNFRRAYLGVQGKAFGDWSYNVNLNFGGSGGTESPGMIQALYIQYDGWNPVAIRIGAYPPPTGLEDATSAQDTVFLERSGPSDVIRNLVGGDGRNAATIMYAGEEVFAAASYTAGKVGDSAVFDEQGAVVGRASYTFKPGANSRVVVSASLGDLFRPADVTALANSARNVNIQLAPELTVDSGGIKLISTGAQDTDSVVYWGAEAAANVGGLYASGGYFSYHVNRRRTPLSDFDFHGWLAQASWVLTGEARGWNIQNATYTAPKPDKPFDLDGGGWGAWEIAARYTDVDLNDREGSAGSPMPLNGIRGGEQKIWSFGINWYPNTVIHFALDYQHIAVDRISTVDIVPGLSGLYPSVGQTVQAVSLRSQVSF